jgi:adenylate cyclase class 2
MTGPRGGHGDPTGSPTDGWRTEYEAKFLDVDAAALRPMLADAPVLEHSPRVLMRRRLFDSPQRRLRAGGSWLRLRDEGARSFLTLKRQRGDGIDSVTETEIEVSDFDAAWLILTEAGLVELAYQESFRERWRCEGFEVTLDEWPWIPPFVEIEGPSADSVRTAAGRLGLDWSAALFGSVNEVYDRYYPSAGQRISDCSLTFDRRPAILTDGQE